MVTTHVMCAQYIVKGDAVEEAPAKPRRVAVFRSGSTVRLSCAQSTISKTELYVLAREPRDNVPVSKLRWEVSRYLRKESGWGVPEKMGTLRLPFGVAADSNSEFGIARPTEKDIAVVYTARGEAGSAGILTYLEYPFLAVGCVETKTGRVVTAGVTAADEAKNLEMRLYGPMRLAGIAMLGEREWLVLSESGHIFEASPSKEKAKGPASGSKPTTMPATVGCGLRVQMVGGLASIADMTPLDGSLPKDRYERRDKARCHGCGQPKGGVVPVLCSRQAKGKGGVNARVLEVHAVKRDATGVVRSSLAARSELAPGMSLPVVLAVDPAREGELWWCSVVTTGNGQQLSVGRYDNKATIQWHEGLHGVSGKLMGGFVDSEGRVSVIFLRTRGDQIEVLELPFGKFQGKSGDGAEVSPK